MSIKISRDQYNEIINRYNIGESTPVIAKDFNVNPLTIINILKKNNVKIRTYSESKRKYKVLHNFFDTIDTQEKAYFLGYLFADGCNFGKYVTLNLSEKDKDMLERLSILIHPKGKPLYMGHQRISRGKEITCVTKSNYHLDIRSERISCMLNKHGCTPKKTTTLKFPFDSLTEDKISHFIRGYFDGDGSISLYSKRGKNTQGYVSIISSSYFCGSLKNILEDTLEIKSKIYNKGYSGNKIVELKITNTKHVIKFLEWIYKGSTIHLNRKYETFQKLLKNREYLSVEKVCCICGKNHYGKSYCNNHYQTYNRKISALNRASKDLLEYLTLSGVQNGNEQIVDLISSFLENHI